MSRPREGELAPDFTLEGPDGPFTLSEQRGRAVVLLFYPGDDTPVCTRQFCSYRDRADDLASLDATVVGISGGGIESKERFAERHGLTVPLLADPGGEVAGLYGVRSPIGPRRAVFVVGPDGVLRAQKVHVLGLRFATVDDIAGMLEGVRA